MLPFGLTPEQEARAARLHRESIIVELMFQGPCGYRSLGADLLIAERQAWEATHRGEIFTQCLNSLSQLAARGLLPDYQEIWRASGITASNIQIIGDHRNGDHQTRLAELRAYPSVGQARVPDDIR